MIRIDRQLVIDQDPDLVWQKLSDFPAMLAMVPSVTGWAVPAPGELVARWKGRLGWIPVTATATLRVVEEARPVRLVVCGAVVGGESRERACSKPGLRTPVGSAIARTEFSLQWHLSPSPAGTVVRYTVVMSMAQALERWVESVVTARLGRLEARLARVVGRPSRVASVAA